jgi:hypothetical protein
VMGLWVYAFRVRKTTKASVSFPNDPLHRSLYFMVARASVAQEGLSSIARSPEYCRSLKGQYVTSGDFVLSSCHYLIFVVSSISSLVHVVLLNE